MSVKLQLTPRQQEILRRVVEEFVATGQPVGSKTLVEKAGLTAASSTVRVRHLLPSLTFFRASSVTSLK